MKNTDLVWGQHIEIDGVAMIVPRPGAGALHLSSGLNPRRFSGFGELADELRSRIRLLSSMVIDGDRLVIGSSGDAYYLRTPGRPGRIVCCDQESSAGVFASLQAVDGLFDEINNIHRWRAAGQQHFLNDNEPVELDDSLASPRERMHRLCDRGLCNLAESLADPGLRATCFYACVNFSGDEALVVAGICRLLDRFGAASSSTAGALSLIDHTLSLGDWLGSGDIEAFGDATLCITLLGHDLGRTAPAAWPEGTFDGHAGRSAAMLERIDGFCRLPQGEAILHAVRHHHAPVPPRPAPLLELLIRLDQQALRSEASGAAEETAGDHELLERCRAGAEVVFTTAGLDPQRLKELLADAGIASSVDGGALDPYFDDSIRATILEVGASVMALRMVRWFVFRDGVTPAEARSAVESINGSYFLVNAWVSDSGRSIGVFHDLFVGDGVTVGHLIQALRTFTTISAGVVEECAAGLINPVRTA